MEGTEVPEQPEGEQQQEETDLISVWNGYRLKTYQWKPTGTPKGMLCFCHGVAEHMGHEKKLGEFLAENGILTFGHDHVGHGRSEGDRVHVETFNTYTADVIQHVERKKGEYPDVPCLLMGHSMGGLLAADVAVQRQELFTGLILSAPALDVDPQSAGPITLFLTRIIAFLLPQLGIRSLNADYMSSIPEEVQQYTEDPLIYHSAMKAKWIASLIASMKAVRPRVNEIKLPLLAIHGTDDHITPFSASEFAVDNVGSADKRLETFEGSRHEILHDKDQERARQVITDWILAHLTPPPQPQQQQAAEREHQQDEAPQS